MASTHYVLFYNKYLNEVEAFVKLIKLSAYFNCIIFDVIIEKINLIAITPQDTNNSKIIKTNVTCFGLNRSIIWDIVTGVVEI